MSRRSRQPVSARKRPLNALTRSGRCDLRAIDGRQCAVLRSSQASTPAGYLDTAAMNIAATAKAFELATASTSSGPWIKCMGSVRHPVRVNMLYPAMPGFRPSPARGPVGDARHVSAFDTPGNVLAGGPQKTLGFGCVLILGLGLG